MDGVRTIAVVEDETDLRALLAEFLDGQGFLVQSAGTWGEFRRHLDAGAEPDLVILDIGLPDASGYEVMQHLRDRPQGAPPIIIVTGATSPRDRSMGLDLGADDYVCKPFDLGELLSRVRAVLRRARTTVTMAPAGDLHIRFGSWLLKRDERVLVHLPEQRVVELTAMEFDLLLAMAQRPHRILTREQLLHLSHIRKGDPFDRAIDVRIARLRRKLEVNPSHPGHIRTVRGAGYVFHPDGTV